MGKLLPIRIRFAAQASSNRRTRQGQSGARAIAEHPGVAPSPPPSVAEKRRTPRSGRLRRARCVFNNGSSSIDVTLRDVSAEGARIAGDGLIALPPEFELLILDGMGAYKARHARLVWARGADAGVAFDD
jgi:hypothetical protein